MLSLKFVSSQFDSIYRYMAARAGWTIMPKKKTFFIKIFPQHHAVCFTRQRLIVYIWFNLPLYGGSSGWTIMLEKNLYKNLPSISSSLFHLQRVLMYLKKRRILIGWKQGHSQVTRVQSCNPREQMTDSAHAFNNFACLFFLRCCFHVNYEKVIA